MGGDWGAVASGSEDAAALAKSAGEGHERVLVRDGRCGWECGGGGLMPVLCPNGALDSGILGV